MYKKWVDDINQSEGGFDKFSKGYESFGLHAQPDKSIKYKEWAPNAVEASLIGDFSQSSVLHRWPAAQVGDPLAEPATNDEPSTDPDGCPQTDGTGKRTR